MIIKKLSRKRMSRSDGAVSFLLPELPEAARRMIPGLTGAKVVCPSSPLICMSKK